MSINRPALRQDLSTALGRSRIVGLLGPRQCGKTTLAREFVDERSANYFDLEDPASLTRLSEPRTALAPLEGLVVIDEIQRQPSLFPLLRVLADRTPQQAQFLILGSADPSVIRGASESLAGRIEWLQMAGFHLPEVGVAQHRRHWLRGGFPLSFLARSDVDSFAWRKNFVRSFLERDLPQFELKLPPPTFLRFWSMLAHYHGQVWSHAEPARALGISEATVRRYLDVLEATWLVRVLQPWHANLAKRQVKSPKVYLRDSGLLHQLLGVHTALELDVHPRVGASWEGYVIEEVLAATQPDEAWFWATHAGAELDLLLVKDGRRIGVECKRVDSPRLTASMRTALEDLQLDRLVVVYPGEQRFQLGPKVEAVPLSEIGPQLFATASPPA